VQDEATLLDEAALVQRAKALDSEAWAAIYLHHYRKIHAYLCHRVGNPDVAEDMASSVFLRAVEQIHTFDYRGIPLTTWLYRIAHNLAVDYVRRVSRVKWEPLEDSIADNGASPERAAEISLDVSELREAMKDLTEDQRQVITLKFFLDLSDAEVAKVIDKREGAVRALQHRALVSLRRLVNRNE